MPHLHWPKGRVWRATLIAIVIGCGASSNASAAAQRLPGIGPTDHRRIVDSTVAPWRAIGRLNRRIGGFCTATVIGPQRVLTAAHCLWNRRTSQFLVPDALHFVAGYDHGSYLADAGVTALQIAPGYDAIQPLARENLARDWAVVTLDRDIGGRTGIVPMAPGSPITAADRLVHAGYSQDKAHVLTRDDGCHALLPSPDARLLKHDCDATFGDSGSPIFVAEGEHLRLVAIHVATTLRSKEPVGYAVLIPRDLPR